VVVGGPDHAIELALDDAPTIDESADRSSDRAGRTTTRGRSPPGPSVRLTVRDAVSLIRVMIGT
jgi:hypothetical protein